MESATVSQFSNTLNLVLAVSHGDFSAAVAAKDEEQDQDNDPAAAVTTESIVAHRETSYKVD